MSTETRSAVTGMGAMLHKDGVSFRLWAPHADEVSVMGEFNEWLKTANPMQEEGNGHWATNVPRAGEGDEYKYRLVNGDQELMRVDPYARHVTNSVGNAIVHSMDFELGEDTFRMPTWNELVIYELHVGTFNDEPGGPPGNLQAAQAKLPYLQELGVNAVQIMPAMEFPGGFSWGYNPSHIFAIESDYGGPDAFADFVGAAHELGIAVLLDVVYNHLGPSDLDLWQFDGWQENGRGGIYFYNDWRAETPWGATRPDYGRPEVRRFLFDNALMWLREYHVDGLRWDATAYIRNVYGNNNDPRNDLPDGWELMRWINREIRDSHPNHLTIAEDLRGNAWITKDVDAGGAGFGSQWASEFVHPIRAALTVVRDEDRDLLAVARAVQHRYNGDPFQRVIYTESHDEVANGKARLPEEISPGAADSYFAKKRSILGAGLVFTVPGIPMIFQGQENLQSGWFQDTRPVDWRRQESFSGILALYRDLIALRRNREHHTRGLSGAHVAVHHLNNADKLLAYHRWYEEQPGPGDSVVVIANFANRYHNAYTVGLPGSGTWRVRLNSDARDYDPDFGDFGPRTVEAMEPGYDGLPFQGQIPIAPYSFLILSQDG